MAFHKIKLTFVVLVLVYLCAWGLKQHILKDKGMHGAHIRDAPRILRWVKNASYPVKALQPPRNALLSTPPITRKPTINGRLMRKYPPNIRDSEIFLGKLGQASNPKNRPVQKKKLVLRDKLAWEYSHPAIEDGVRKMYGKKEAAANLRRRRSKYATGAWRVNATRPRKSATATKNDVGDFHSSRFWGRTRALKCLGPKRYRRLRWRGRAGRLERLKLVGSMWSACVAEVEGQRALPFLHNLGRSLGILRRVWASIVVMYRQERVDNVRPLMYLEKIRQLKIMMNILNKIKGSIRHWGKNLHQNFSPCFQCFPVWLQYIDWTLTEQDEFDFLLSTKMSLDWLASSSLSSTTLPRFKLKEFERGMRLSPPIAALLVKMTELLNDQSRRISGLNSSLYGLRRSLSPATHAWNESMFHSLSQNFNTIIWVQRNRSDDLPKRRSFCQNLIHSLIDVFQTARNLIQTLYEHVVRGVKFLCHKLSDLRDLGLMGINKWLISQYNQLQIQLARKIMEHSDFSSDYDAPLVGGELKLNESTIDLGSNESQQVIRSEAGGKSDTIIPNATARNIVPNGELGFTIVNKTKTHPTSRLAEESAGQINESTGMPGEMYMSRSTVDHGPNDSRGVGRLKVESRVDTVLPNAPAGDSVSNKTIDYSNVSLRTTSNSSKPVLKISDVPQKGGLYEKQRESAFSFGEAYPNNDSRAHFRTKMKDILKIWIRFLVVLRYVEKHVSNNDEVFAEKQTQNSWIPAINNTLTDQTWRLTRDTNNQAAKFERIQKKDLKSLLKTDAQAKLFKLLQQRGISNVNETRKSSNMLETHSTDKHLKRVNALNGGDRLVELWISKTRQLSRILTWLVLLPQRTLSFIRRVELVNLKLRIDFFKRIFKTRIDSQQRGQEDDKTERLGKVTQRVASRNEQLTKSVEKKDDKQAKFKVVWKFHIFNIKDSKKYNRINETAQLKDLETSPTKKSSVFEERPDHFNNAKHVSPQLRKKSQNTAIHVLHNDSDKQLKRLKRPAYVQLQRRRRSSRASGDDEALKRQMKELRRIANNHKKDRFDDLLTSEKFVQGSNQRKFSSLKSKANRPASSHFSKEAADALRSKLINLIRLVEIHKNGTPFSGFGNVTKGKYHDAKLNLDDKYDFTQRSGDSSEYNFEEPAEDLSFNALNGEPTEADFELLNNIEILTKKFLGKRNRKIRNDYLGRVYDFNDNSDRKHRRKRSEDRDEDTAGELGEIPESDQMRKTGPDDKVKESRQFLQKWSALKKEAQNLQTEVNSARDKYNSASEELALLLKKGNTLHDKVESASGAEGVHKSMLEENWKNVNKEFDKYKSDMAAREREILSEDKRVNAEKIDHTLFKLEDAISEQGDPNDRILGDTAVLPFNAKLDRMDPALKSMKNEALLAGQIASDEVMLESEDAEDDVFKESEAGDYSIVDFDYGPDAKFVDEEDSDIAEDAESLTGFDYEIDRHSDAQLEDVDNMLSKLIARRFRSKRSRVVPVLKGLKKTPEATMNNKVLYDTIWKKTSPKTLRNNNSTTAGVPTLWHPVNRRASPTEIKQALNSVDEESGDYDEKPDVSDEIKDIEGEKIVGETDDLTADNKLDHIPRYNLSNPKLRAKANRLMDVAANKEAKSFGRVNTKKVGKFKTASDLLGYDSSDVGINAKQLDESIRHNNDMVAMSLGSDVDIENGIEEIRREKEFLTAEGERIDEDIPSDDELKPFDQVINENMEDLSDEDFNNARDDTWKQKANLETAQLKLIDADEEKQKMELAASSEAERNRERFQHNSDVVELGVINNGLDKAFVNLDQATKDLHKPPPRPSGDDLVISLYAAEQEDEINEEAPGGSEALVRKRRSVNWKMGRNRAKLDLAYAPTIKPNYSSKDETKEKPSEANAEKIVPNSGSNQATIERRREAKAATIEPNSGFKDAMIEPHSPAKKGNYLIGFKISADTNTVASTRIEREANPNISDDDREAATAEGDIDIDLDEEVEEDKSMIPGMYDDDVLYENDDSVAEEWEIAKPSRKLKKPKKVANNAAKGIEGQLLDAKSVVRQLKEEEDIAGDLLPPSSLVNPEQDLMEFGRKPDSNDMFLNVNPVGLAELSDEEVTELNGPVLSSTDIENALDNPTALVSALEDIENEIKSPKHSVLKQTLDINRLDGTSESAEKVLQQIGDADEISSGVLERKAFFEGFDALDDVRRTRLTQKLLDEQEEKDSELMDGGNALGEALQDLDQYKVDKEMDQLRPFITFKDVLQKKKTKTLK